jgi:tRNA (cmo5U34)-methyltransferase
MRAVNLVQMKDELFVVKKQDKIYASPLEEIVDFRFDEKVVDVFPDMIQRSVPGYGLMISGIGVLASQYAQENSQCYDLGCSLGAASLAMQQRISAQNCSIFAVDNSSAMIERARDLLPADQAGTHINLVCADIQDVAIENASVVVLNLTLQFIPLEKRLDLITRIYAGLNPGGILILSEKTTFPDVNREKFQKDLHENFKRAQGYSDLEISQKRTALETVMVPETLECHNQRLQDAGFGFIDVWFQCLNFVSLVAVK